MEIDPSIYNEIDMELKEKYIQFTGINVDEKETKSKYTEIEILEKYAINYLFWIIEEKINDDINDNDPKKLTRQFMISQSKSMLLKSINQKFDKIMQRNIFYKINIYYNFYNFNIDFKNELNKLREILSNYNTQSIELYELAKLDLSVNSKLVDPIAWLENQEEMRSIYEKYNPLFKNNISYYNYMKFMYENYPENFNKELLKLKEDHIMVDGVELYYRLKNNIKLDSVENTDQFIKINKKKKISSKSLKHKQKQKRKLEKIKLKK